MKVFLDDRRDTPEGWVRCYWPDEVIDLLKTGKVEAVSLDHDLGDDARGTGYTVIQWIEEQVHLEDFWPPEMFCHSDNAPGRERIQKGIEEINRYWEQRMDADRG